MDEKGNILDLLHAGLSAARPCLTRVKFPWQGGVLLLLVCDNQVLDISCDSSDAKSEGRASAWTGVWGASRVKNTRSQGARWLHVEMLGIQDENLGGKWNLDFLFSNHTHSFPGNITLRTLQLRKKDCKMP